MFQNKGKYWTGNKKGISTDNLRSQWGTVEEKHPCFQNNYISDFLWSWEISWKLIWSYLCFSCIQPCTLQCCCSCELQKGEISGFQSFRRGDISIILMEPNSRHERAWWTSLPTQTSHLRKRKIVTKMVTMRRKHQRRTSSTWLTKWSSRILYAREMIRCSELGRNLVLDPRRFLNVGFRWSVCARNTEATWHGRTRTEKGNEPCFSKIFNTWSSLLVL